MNLEKGEDRLNERDQLFINHHKSTHLNYFNKHERKLHG